MTKKTKKVNYVQLEPAAFLSDDDFQMMTDAERGIYCTIIFYMFCNNGRIKNDPKAIKRLCNVTSNFEQKWESVMSKLYQKGVWLRHRRVDLEIKKAKKFMQHQRKAGLASAAARQPRLNSGSNQRNETKRNEFETNSKTKGKETSNSKRDSASVKNSLSASNSFRFIVALETIIRPRNQSDRTTNRNLLAWIEESIAVNRFNEDIYKRILDYAKEAKQSGRNPAAMFCSILQRELGYRKKVVRG